MQPRRKNSGEDADDSRDARQGHSDTTRPTGRQCEERILANDATSADEGLEVRDAMRDAIARLDPEAAELVRLLHWERLSLVQAAEILRHPGFDRARPLRARKQEPRAMLGASVER